MRYEEKWHFFIGFLAIIIAMASVNVNYKTTRQLLVLGYLKTAAAPTDTRDQSHSNNGSKDLLLFEIFF